jgi:hypothetical protein
MRKRYAPEDGNHAAVAADRRLLGLADSYFRNEAALAKADRDEYEAQGNVAAERRLDRAIRRQGSLAHAVLSAPAMTARAALAKLEVAAAWFRPDTDHNNGSPITHHADDALIAIADELAAVGLSSAALAQGPRKAPVPDAELVALAREFRAGAPRRAASTRELDAAARNGSNTAAIERIERVRDLLLDKRDALYAPIARAPARTLEGFIAKLTVAAEEMAESDHVMDLFTGDKTPNYVLASAVVDALTLAADARDLAHLATIREALGFAAS